MNFVEKGVKIFILTALSITFRGAAELYCIQFTFFPSSWWTSCKHKFKYKKKGKKTRKLPEMAPRKLAIALHAKIPWKDTRILKTVQRIRNRARSLKAIVNIVSVGLRLVTILEQVLCYTTYIYVRIVIELWCMYIQTKLVSYIHPFAIEISILIQVMHSLEGWFAIITFYGSLPALLSYMKERSKDFGGK